MSMKKLTRNQWVGVTAGLVVIAIFFITGQSFISFFSPSRGDGMAGTQTDMGAQAQEALETSSQTETMDTTNSFASSVGGNSLEIQDVVVGTGAEATAGKMITVNYTGAFTDGRVFDTSVGRGPFQFKLGAGQVIQGWDKGFDGMKVGGKRRLVIPPAMGYGAAGAGGVIPPNATLVFEVELLEVK